MSSTEAYTPPEGFRLVSGGTWPEQFERTSLEGKELWLLRIPDNIKAKHLEGLTVKLPKSAHKGIMGEAKIDKTTYKIVSSKADTATEFAGMHEINVMVPDSDESGNLTLLPNRPKHLVSLVETIEIPESFDAAQKIRNREHPAREQPENMKMQFVPFGFYSAEDYMQMNGMQAESLSMPAAEEPAKKKRKVSADVETPVSPKADKKKAKKEKKDKGKKEKDTDVDVEMTPASPKADKKAAKKERREKKPKHKKSKE